MSRRLVILRHARAEHGFAGPDHDRSLTESGRAQALEAGRRLALAGLVPDHVICSTATRTRQTLDGVLAELPARPSVEFEESAYAADLDTAFALINAADPDVGTLLLVGHNPTMADLASAFIDDPGLVSFPPASLAVVDLEVEWLYAAPGTGDGRILDGEGQVGKGEG
ncbi:SixA phosphatase family protein [Nocardiopsis sediminis]|uniref:SixA phosphatase family protein n=1 Tax=Nocardiopsis sediminis TaxID=1778267 RepID=A0ABV8FUW3_9ACTN